LLKTRPADVSITSIDAKAQFDESRPDWRDTQ